MSNDETSYLIVNFGGPRDLNEVEEFLIALLTDQEVIQTRLPGCIHRYLFKKVARQRACRVIEDYAHIGGRSPIFEDTEMIAKHLRSRLDAEVLTFHRYLPRTHASFIKAIEGCRAKKIYVFPLFPQFSYTTTGSIALWFQRQLTHRIRKKLCWIPSYPAHPEYLKAWKKLIEETLTDLEWKEEETIFLFSAHGLPKDYVIRGDTYEQQCQETFFCLTQAFPLALSKLCYQSQFGKSEWLRPYTVDCCEKIDTWREQRGKVLVIPLSFTSDHIETLFEIQEQYLPLLEKKGLQAKRCPAFNLRADWLDAIVDILHSVPTEKNEGLYRKRLFNG